MAKNTGLTDSVRAVFEARKDRPLSTHEIFAAMHITAVHMAGDRDAVRNVLKELTSCGYLNKLGRYRMVAYQYSGQGMRGRHKQVSAEDRRQRRNERQREYRAEQAALQPPRAAGFAAPKPVRIGRQAGMNPAKPFAHQQPCAGPLETVEQFLARGGQVQRLSAHWEHEGRAA